MKVAGSNPAIGIVFYTKNASKGIWCSGITRHFDCLEPSSSLGIPVAEWRSLVISSGSCPEDRWFKSTFCYFSRFHFIFHIVFFIGRDVNVLTNIAQWRSLAIAPDLGSGDRRFKSYLCNQRAVWWSVLFSTKIFSLLAFGRWANHIHLPLLSVFGSFKSGKSTYF